MAERFLSNAEASFTELARQPRMGAPLTLKHPDLAGIRKWRVKDLDNQLVFYEPRPDGVSIARVLHAAFRDGAESPKKYGASEDT